MSNPDMHILVATPRLIVRQFTEDEVDNRLGTWAPRQAGGDR
jgi:hypothetical protein